MLQTTEQYKTNWLRKQCFRVKMECIDPSEYVTWLEENLERKVWAMSAKPDQGVHNFFFEKATDASEFRKTFKGDSRTVDIG